MRRIRAATKTSSVGIKRVGERRQTCISTSLNFMSRNRSCSVSSNCKSSDYMSTVIDRRYVRGAPRKNVPNEATLDQ